jgi:hypothetical protein
MPDSTSQKKIILHHLRDIGPLTPGDARLHYGCSRLSARIFELKRDGILIGSELVEIEGKYVSKYSYVHSEPNGQIILSMEGAHG